MSVSIEHILCGRAQGVSTVPEEGAAKAFPASPPVLTIPETSTAAGASEDDDLIRRLVATNAWDANSDSTLGAVLTELADTRMELKGIERDMATSMDGAAVARVVFWIVEHWWPSNNHNIPKALTQVRLAT